MRHQVLQTVVGSGLSPIRSMTLSKEQSAKAQAKAAAAAALRDNDDEMFS